MYNAGKIIVGIIIFLVLVSVPFWYNREKAATPPELAKPATAALIFFGNAKNECVESIPYMKASHMKLLDQWRNDVVREGKRIYMSSTGKQYPMSLQNTCTKCHDKKSEFCDRCHNYVEVSPKCWDCHIAPKENSSPKE